MITAPLALMVLCTGVHVPEVAAIGSGLINPNQGIDNVQNQVSISLDVRPVGDPADMAKRERRNYASHNVYQPTGIYVDANTNVKITVEGAGIDEDDKPIKAYIGLSGRDNGIKEFSLNKSGTTTITAGPNGGLLQLDNANDQEGDPVRVTIEGGKQIPLFTLGKHNNTDWQRMMREYSNADSVQLVSDRVVLTVSYAAAQKHITDPTGYMTKFNNVIKALDTALGFVENPEYLQHFVSPRPEAFIEDKGTERLTTPNGVKFGSDYVEALLKPEVKFNRDIPWWFLIMHAAGARQQESWAWQGTENWLGLKRAAGYSVARDVWHTLNPEKDFSELDDYFYAKAKEYHQRPKQDFTTIHRDAARHMLFQLHQLMGSNGFKQLYIEYRNLDDQDLPRTDAQKQQEFIVTTSRVSGYDLRPFFEAWGLKAMPATIEKMKTLTLRKLNAPIWLSSHSNKINPSDTIIDGWYNVGTDFRCFYENGAIVKGSKRINDKDYYFSDSGVMLKGQQSIDGATINFHPTEGHYLNTGVIINGRK